MKIKKKKRTRKLKLFVWDNIFVDYTSGIAFALARDVSHARKLILKECTDGGRYHIGDDDMKRLQEEPVVITRPKGDYICGGG